MGRWFPVARSAEIEPRHIAQTQLLGQEIALWRSDVGTVNAWENRCPHRGVRFSIGQNTGSELRCAYHGWRFASGSGQCTYIPAHPMQKPASSIRAGVYAAVERYHLVWVNLDSQAGADGAEIRITGFVADGTVESSTDATLRSIFVDASVEAVRGALLQGYCVDAATTASLAATDPYTLLVTTASLGLAPAVAFLLQPATDTQTVVHGLLRPESLATDRLAVLRHHNAQLSRLRDEVERRSRAS